MRATGNLVALEAAGVPEKSTFGWYNYINGRVANPPGNIPDVLDLFVGVFGNPPGEAEMDFTPSMGQALFLLNERLLQHWLEPGNGNLIELVKKQTDSSVIVETMYLTIYSRRPTETERNVGIEFLTTHKARGDLALADLAWALIASDEFRMNH